MQKQRAKLIREVVCSNAWWSVGLGAFFPLGHGFDYKSFALWLILVLCFGEIVLGAKSLLAEVASGKLARRRLANEHFCSFAKVIGKRAEEAQCPSSQLWLQVIFSKAQLEGEGLSHLLMTFFFLSIHSHEPDRSTQWIWLEVLRCFRLTHLMLVLFGVIRGSVFRAFSFGSSWWQRRDKTHH